MRVQMRSRSLTTPLSLREYQTTTEVRLTRDERQALQALAPSITVVPSRWIEGSYDLTPGSWVGAVDLPTLSVEIRPKVPIDRVFFLISYALNPRAWRTTSFDFESAPTLFEAMIPPFVAAASQ